MASSQLELSLLAKTVARVDFLYEPNPRQSLLREDSDILARRRNRLKQRMKVNELSPYCLRIFLDDSALESNQLDAADIQEEIDYFYPGCFEILRSVRQPHQRYLRLRMRPTLVRVSNASDLLVPLNHTNQAAHPALASFVSQFKRASSRIYRTSSVPNGDGGDNSSGEQSEVVHDATMLGVEEFFLYIQQHDWVLHATSRGVIRSTSPSVTKHFSRMTYNPATKYLEVGEQCTRCKVLFLPRELLRDGLETGNCYDCFGQNFSRCKSCNATSTKQDAVIAPCGCEYCEPCFGRHFAAGLASQKFPPKCCDQELDVIKYRKHIPESSLKLYAQTVDTFHDPIQLHCAAESCRSYIKRSLISNEWGLCENCFAVTCQKCRLLRQSHTGLESDSHRKCPDRSSRTPEVASDPINITKSSHTRRDPASDGPLWPPSPQEMPVAASPETDTPTFDTIFAAAAAQDPSTSSSKASKSTPGPPSTPNAPTSPTPKHSSTPSSPSATSPSTPAGAPSERCKSHNWRKMIVIDGYTITCDKCRTVVKSKAPMVCSTCGFIVCWTCRTFRRVT